jgi:hypothetical protein
VTDPIFASPPDPVDWAALGRFLADPPAKEPKEPVVTAYIPDETILPEYTDERLRSEATGYARDVADLMLTIPAGYRRPVEVEVARRAYRRTVSRTAGGLPEAGREQIADPCDTRRRVVAEVWAQLGREVAG